MTESKLEDIVQRLDDLVKKLSHIEALLVNMPETHATVFLTMQEEADIAHLYAQKCSDIWTVAKPSQR